MNDLRRQYNALAEKADQNGIDMELRPHWFPDRWEIVLHWHGEAKFMAATPSEVMQHADLWMCGYTTRVAEEIRTEQLKREDMQTFIKGLETDD